MLLYGSPKWRVEGPVNSGKRSQSRLVCHKSTFQILCGLYQENIFSSTSETIPTSPSHSLRAWPISHACQWNMPVIANHIVRIVPDLRLPWILWSTSLSSKRLFLDSSGHDSTGPLYIACFPSME